MTWKVSFVGQRKKHSPLTKGGRGIFFFALALWLSGCCASEPAPLNVTTAVFPNVPEPPPPAWASHYGGEIEAVAPTEEERVLWRAVEEKTGRSCIPDGKLIRGARRHARDLLESRAVVVDGQVDRLRFTLHQLGAYDYAIEPITQKLGKDSTALVSAIARDTSAWTHCGRA